MDKNRVNTEVYNENALAMATKFNKIGPRVADIQRAFELLGKDTGKVVELGCGNGRDAVEILKHTKDFVGMDISEGMIKLARENNPGVDFQVDTIEGFNIPDGTDIIFAFASLLHLNKSEVKEVLKRAHEKLNDGGIVYISVKKKPYHEELVEDSFGKRYFYFYQLSDFEELAKETEYEIVHTDEQTLRGVDWLTIVLRKVV
jgi:SAM-dependent methyltransferase